MDSGASSTLLWECGTGAFFRNFCARKMIHRFFLTEKIDLRQGLKITSAL